MEKKIYLSGKFSEGFIEESSKKMVKYKKQLENDNWFVFSPIDMSYGLNVIKKNKKNEIEQTKNYDRSLVYKFDVYSIIHSDAILVLNNWKTSCGALGELMIAINMGLDVYIENDDNETFSLINKKEFYLNSIQNKLLSEDYLEEMAGNPVRLIYDP